MDIYTPVFPGSKHSDNLQRKQFSLQVANSKKTISYPWLLRRRLTPSPRPPPPLRLLCGTTQHYTTTHDGRLYSVHANSLSEHDNRAVLDTASPVIEVNANSLSEYDNRAASLPEFEVKANFTTKHYEALQNSTRNCAQSKC